MDSMKTTLVDADPENTQTSERIEINTAIEGESNDTDGNGGDWFTVARKRRRDASHPTTTTGESKPDRAPNQAHERKPRLPPLPPSDYKIVFRPRDGLDFSKWQSHRVARAVRQTAHITAAESDALTLRIRNEPNLAVASTPKEELAERIRRITTIQLGGKEYQVYAYVAAPDMSCKVVATGIDSETHPDELMDNLRSPQATILFARMLGKSTAALITFDRLEVPRTIYYYGGELLCRPYRPLSQVCSICLKTGHRADICPTPESARCKNCGHENPSEDHQCQPKCVLCEGDHPVTDPSCPARQRKPFNKSRFLRNAGYTSDANNVPTTTNPGTSTNQPKTPGSKSPPASTETNVDRGRSPRRSTDFKKRDKSRDASTSRSQSLPRAKTPRHERHEAAANGQGAESRSTIDMLEKSERKAVTKGPGTNRPKICESCFFAVKPVDDLQQVRGSRASALQDGLHGLGKESCSGSLKDASLPVQLLHPRPLHINMGPLQDTDRHTDHIIRGWSKDPLPSAHLRQSPWSEAWDRALMTTSLNAKLRAPKRAEEVATRHGLTSISS
ncbi:hypothetical protein HPB49_016697 [Dermacentor silvarum]|uniref:Uncharacterized protein n=1 Tax=Dermacentor silvarum TaxID=543639 RepID=A0ACB8C4G7_DERSI|nr:hypothetical protein HPB49_016697 [Dermacentor silvarum]